ncbi:MULTISPECIES: hypothetical protein [Pseudomonas]|uniref:Mobilization protein, MobE n=1 Tax=Pseudomonas syringae pv. papulans TaxID=83963 RepID=A0AA43IXV2_PSESX|nr:MULTISPECIES: hypothetical protein [Pseudomonas]MDH4603767.1 hypothetical protein [Pseudomonas syringae pv. papulans]MDH4625578.1 hypothetical protein [Pseudomonas syringae pv. papulans]
MDDIESSFKELLGRQPSEKEVERLYRVKNALNIRDNDAIWMILMALESYDTLYSKYPGLIAGQVDVVIEKQRELIADIVDAESKKALSTLSSAVARTSELVASRVADTARWQAWGWVCVGLILFGSLCLTAGYVLGSGNMPFWALTPQRESPFSIVMSILMRAPVGWLVPLIGTAVVVVTLASNRQLPIKRPVIISLVLMAAFSIFCVHSVL